MGIKDNFSQAMKDFINPKEPSSSQEKKPEMKDVAAYMNEPAGNTVNTAEQTINRADSSASGAANNQAGNPSGVQNSFNQQGAFNSANAQNTSDAGNIYSFDSRNRGTADGSPMNSSFANPISENRSTAFGNSGMQSNSGTAASIGGFSASANPGNSSNSETTVISKNTIIDGNIRSFADMCIDGNVKGNVETTKNVSINGKIIGNVTCDNAVLNSSSVQGNINLKGQISMANDSMLIGDLSSQIANLNGKIKGNLNITGKAQLDKDAVIFGDIKASTIAISDGAIIQGYISTTFLSKEESSNIFPESIAIGE